MHLRGLVVVVVVVVEDHPYGKNIMKRQIATTSK
jgi:hypothetical protein